MTPIKKKDLKYAMRTAIILAELAHRMRDGINNMTWLIEEGVDSAELKDAKIDGFSISGDFEDVRKAYDNFVSEAITMRNHIDELYRKEG